ncbi:MAG TPA: sigma-70 family RNA polymerase sigma factor [Candidatus Acidoferrum sp.]|nr:sigma-70 family RNA polymerase sigma factor [Candidatus Acidoferrum sp.]
MSDDFQNRNGNSNPHETARDARSDEQLMLEVQRGDGDAFTVLFDRYNRLVLTVALRIVHDVGEAQEVTQNVFFEFYRAARRFDPARGTLKVWLLQFAYHRSINRRNYLLLRQFYNRPDLDDAMVWEASAKTTPRIPAQELKHLVEQALTTLPETDRRIVEKVVFEGLTLREVAEQSGASYNAVRNKYYRALGVLRVCLVPKAHPAVNEGIVGLGEVSRGKA